MGDMWRRARLLLLASAVGIAPALTGCGDDEVSDDGDPPASGDAGRDSAVIDEDASTGELPDSGQDAGSNPQPGDEDAGMDAGPVEPVGDSGPNDADAGDAATDAGSTPDSDAGDEPTDAGEDGGSLGDAGSEVDAGPVCELPNPGTIDASLRAASRIYLLTDCGAIPAGEQPENMVDGATNTKFLCFAALPTIGVAFDQLGSHVVKTYTLTSANDAPGRDPKHWRFEGSHDGVTWELLDERTNQSFGARGETHRFDLVNCTAYSRYRLVVVENHGASIFQMAELGLYGVEGEPSSFLPVGSVTSTCPNTENAREDDDAAFDTNVGSKWFCRNNAAPQVAVTFADTQAHVVTSYEITSGNDSPDRDPADWVIEGSNDGTSWEALTPAQAGQTFTARASTRSFTLTNDKAFTHYRLSVGATGGSADFQVNEISFYGQ